MYEAVTALHPKRPTLDHAADVLDRHGYYAIATRLRRASRYGRDDKRHVELAEAYRLAYQAGILSAGD